MTKASFGASTSPVIVPPTLVLPSHMNFAIVSSALCPYALLPWPCAAVAAGDVVSRFRNSSGSGLLPTAAGRLGNEDLRYHSLEDERQLGADLGLLVGGENIEDAVDRLDGRVRVQGREHEGPRPPNGPGGLDRLEIPHFSDEDDVRVLSQDVLQGLFKALGVRVHLPPVGEALLVGGQGLDRVPARADG